MPVFFVLILLLFLTSAEEATRKPFDIFQPGDFFDPFTEKGFRDNQPSGSIVPQPNLIFGEPNTVFSQPFRHLPQPTGGYSRPMGFTSGNKEQFNAQIWQPQAFFAELSRFQPKAPIPITYSQRKIAPNKQVLTTQINVLPVPYKQVAGQIARPSAVSVQHQPGSEHGEASHVVARSRQLESHHPNSHAASNLIRGGHHHDAGHNVNHGDQESKGYKSNHHHSTGEHEKHDDHHKESHHKEKGGNIVSHHDEAGHYKKHHEGKKSHKAAKFGEKKGHKRGHKTKGYHNKFHRDEYHREHRFYDDYHKEGYHEKHGNAHSNYKKKEGGHKKGGSHKSGKSDKHHGKKGYSKKGHLIDANKGFSKEAGRKKYHKHHKDHHKKNGSVNGKKYGYKSEH